MTEAWPIATSMFWLPNPSYTTLQTLNKTSTTKLSSIYINFMFNLVTSWQHMATFQRFQSTTTRTYQDRTCSRVCPTYSPGVPGLCRVASCDDGYESRTNVEKTRGKQRSSKIFQDVSTVTKRCLNFRSSFSEFQTKSPARLL